MYPALLPRDLLGLIGAKTQICVEDFRELKTQNPATSKLDRATPLWTVIQNLRLTALVQKRCIRRFRGGPPGFEVSLYAPLFLLVWILFGGVG